MSRPMKEFEVYNGERVRFRTPPRRSSGPIGFWWAFRKLLITFLVTLLGLGIASMIWDLAPYIGDGFDTLGGNLFLLIMLYLISERSPSYRLIELDQQIGTLHYEFRAFGFAMSRRDIKLASITGFEVVNEEPDSEGFERSSLFVVTNNGTGPEKHHLLAFSLETAAQYVSGRLTAWLENDQLTNHPAA